MNDAPLPRQTNAQDKPRSEGQQRAGHSDEMESLEPLPEGASTNRGGAPASASSAWSHGLDGLRSTIAEVHAHRAFLAVDPSAKLIGGNYAIRDHELFDNTAWANTKTAWPHGVGGDLLGFSPVSWARARDPYKPQRQLDLVALVPIGSDDLSVRDAGINRIDIHWSCDHFWVVPASVLQTISFRDGKSIARSVVPLAALSDYLVDGHHRLTTARLAEIVSHNVVAIPPLA